MTVKQTKRKIGRILFAVQSKLTQLLQSQDSNLQGDDVVAAMRDPKVRETIFTNMRRDSIKLVHRESNEPVFKRETTQLGERGERALNESPNAAHEESKMEIDPEEATLQVDSQAYEELNAQVKDFIRRNSMKQ